MGEFLQNNWFWIVLIFFFVWMHRTGRGCCSGRGTGNRRQGGDTRHTTHGSREDVE